MTKYLQIENIGTDTHGDKIFELIVNENFISDLINNGITKVYDQETKPSVKDIAPDTASSFKFRTSDGFEGTLNLVMYFNCTHTLKMRVSPNGKAEDVSLYWRDDHGNDHLVTQDLTLS